MARRLLLRQSQGYDISRPTVVYTYDFLTGTDNYPILNDQEFDRFTPQAFAPVVDDLSISNYAYGNKPVETGRGDSDSFYLSLTFSTKNQNLVNDQLKYKFQVELRNEKIGSTTAQDTGPINLNYAVPATFIAGDFRSNAGIAKSTKKDNVLRGLTNVYRSNTTLAGSLGFRMFSQRTGEDDFAQFEQSSLSEFQTSLKKVSSTSERATYEIVITWPKGTALRAFYNFLKCRWIYLSIGNVFHEVFARGFVEKNPWDRYSDNLKNQLYNLTIKRYPTFQLSGLSVPEERIKNNADYPEIARINAMDSGRIVTVDANTKIFNYKSTDLTNGIKDLYIFPQSYIASSGLESSMLFIKDSYILIAYRPKRSTSPSFTYVINPPKPDPVKKFNYSTYLTSLILNSSAGSVKWTLKHSDFQNAARAFMGMTPPAGDYIAYVITNITAGDYSTSNRVFSVSPKLSGKFKSDLIIKYSWKEGN
jgi:hypothetical protein